MALLGRLFLAAMAGVVLAAAGFKGWQVFGLLIAMTLWDWSNPR